MQLCVWMYVACQKGREQMGEGEGAGITLMNDKGTTDEWMFGM